MTRRYIIQGITDEVSVCDCCGKANLQKTVCFADNATGEFVYFGTTCAARNTGATVKEHQTARREIEAAARQRAMQSPEYKALDNLRSKLHAAGVLPGKAFRDATRSASEAYKAVERAAISQAFVA